MTRHREDRRELLASARGVIEDFQPMTVNQAIFQNRMLMVADELEDRIAHGDETLSAEVLWTLLRFAPDLLRKQPEVEHEMKPEAVAALAAVERVRGMLAGFDNPDPMAEWSRLMLRVTVDSVALNVHLGRPDDVTDAFRYLDTVAASFRLVMNAA